MNGNAKTDITEDETKQAYNKIASEWHKKRIDKKNFYNNFLDMPNTLAVLGNVKGKTVLDVGCGTGVYAKALLKRGAVVYGIDISEKEIEIARKWCKNGNFVVGTASKLPYPDKSFDVVLMALMFTHLDEMDKALEEVRRVLKPHGRLIVSEGNPFTGATVRIKGKPRTYRRFYNYFDEGVTHTRWKMDKYNISMPSRRITMETMLKLFIKHGFALRNYKDSKPVYEGKKVHSAGYSFTSVVPFFMVMDFIMLSPKERRQLFS